MIMNLWKSYRFLRLLVVFLTVIVSILGVALALSPKGAPKVSTACTKVAATDKTINWDTSHCLIVTATGKATINVKPNITNVDDIGMVCPIQSDPKTDPCKVTASAPDGNMVVISIYNGQLGESDDTDYVGHIIVTHVGNFRPHTDWRITYQYIPHAQP